MSSKISANTQAQHTTVWIPRVCRALAVLIAIAAVVDPAIRTMRRGRPMVSVVAVNPTRDSALTANIVTQLDRNYTVVPSAFPLAEATVLIGAQLPPWTSTLAMPVVIIAPVAIYPDIVMHRIDAPERAALESRVTVAVVLAVHGLSADSVQVELVDGTVVVARERRRMQSDSVITIPLSFVPTRAEPTVLQLRAFIAEHADTIRHDILVNVEATRWSVLFFDRRPSWMSTFVRRALERDPRFAVSSRILTSTNVSRQTGQSPLALEEIGTGAAYDVIVVGAPDALTARDVNALATMLRTRGASVVVLPDHPFTGPLDALLDIGQWTTANRRSAVDITSALSSTAVLDLIKLRGGSIGIPSRLPPRAEIIAEVEERAASLGSPRVAKPVIWRVPVGLGSLTVSGAFDAWRYRDPAQSTFDATWRDIMNSAATHRVASMEIRVTPTVVTPRARMDVVASVRDARSAATTTVDVRALADSGATAFAIAMDTDTSIDQQRTQPQMQRHAQLRAPAQVGTYEIRMTNGVDTVRTPFVVLPSVAQDLGDDMDLMSAWAASRGGRVIAREHRDSVPAVLDQLMHVTPRSTSWHPMRSPWWIVPFALLLSVEWWTRRRRGLS